MDAFDPQKATDYLRNLGYSDDSAEMKALTSYAQFAAPKPEAPVDYGKAAIGALSAGAIAGLSRWGGADHNQAVAAGVAPVDRLMTLNRQTADKQREFAEKFGGAAFEARMKQISDEKRRKQLGDIMRPGGSLPVAPGGAPGAVTAPIEPVERGPIYDAAPVPSAGPGGPGSSLQPPSPSAQPPPLPNFAGSMPAPSASVSPVSVPEASPGPTPGAPGAGPTSPASPARSLSKYQIDETALDPLPYTEQQISAASLVDDKAADNMRQINDQTIKQNDQRIKLSEQQRAAAQNDPELAYEIETRKKQAGADVERQTAQRTTSRESAGVFNTLERLYNLPDNIEDFDSYVGAFDSANPLGIRDILNPGSVPIRNKIAGDTQAIAVAMKKFVRQAGEGGWSDSDQAGLERMVGNLTSASNSEDFRTIVADIRERISSAFTEPSGTRLPDLVRQKDLEGSNGKQKGDAPAARPHDEPVGATRQLPDGRMVQKVDGGWAVVPAQPGAPRQAPPTARPPAQPAPVRAAPSSYRGYGG